MSRYIFYLTYSILRYMICLKVDYDKLRRLKMSCGLCDDTGFLYFLDSILFTIVFVSFCLFIILKLTGIVSWSWWFLLVPVFFWFGSGVIIDFFEGDI